MPPFELMTGAHFLYVPFVLMVGLMLGYVLGTRAVHAKLEKQRRKMKE
jgi:hypothetical protein